MRRFGQNTAAEYWVARDKGNYRKLTYGETTFWVLRSEQVEETLPADNVVSEKMAALLVTAVLNGGPKLVSVMEELSVLQPNKASLSQLQASFGSHAIVIKGDLPQKYFPRCYKHHAGKRICTCGTFTQRGKCPHVYYVGALEGELDLENLPTRKKPGRKRAAPGTSQEDNAKHQKTQA